jgi:hypothetical protein
MSLRTFTANLTQSTGASGATTWFYVGEMAKISMIVGVTGDGSAAGTVSVNVSNDVATGGGSMMSFTPSTSFTLASPSVTVSGNGVQAVTPLDIAYQWMQIVYTRSAGTGGVVSATISGHD